MSPATTDVGTSMSKLSIHPPHGPRDEPVTVADSWEEESSSGSDTERKVFSATSPARTPPLQTRKIPWEDYPRAPPPTPSSSVISTTLAPSNPYTDQFPTHPSQAFSLSARAGVKRSAGADEKRPEKSAAVAARLIAAGLGVRVPKQTQEQKQFEKASKQRKKREKEEAIRAEREKESARKAIWDD